MIIRILKNSKSFAGVNYNEKKVNQNMADLVEAYNFGQAFSLISNPTGEDYKRIFNMLKESNSRIKASQFHAALSCKGREYSKEQLVAIGKQWLSAMGYSGLPTMIYFHKDTDNNHIHMITSRVGWDGKKINDSFEHTRAVSSLNKIMENDITYMAKKDFADALSYVYSNRNQFALLLERRGYDVKIASGAISLYKYGQEVLCRSVDLVDWSGKRNMANKEDDSKRKKQLAAILWKYTPGLTREQLQDIMKSKFGVELVFHRGKDHANPYGYTIIDHSKKTVYKGGDILSFKKMEDMLSKRIDPLNYIDKILLQEGKRFTLKELNDDLKKYGLYVKSDAVYHRKSGIMLADISSSTSDLLKYNFRLTKAMDYGYSSSEEKEILANRFNVEAKDIPDNVREVNTDYYRAIMQNAINSGNEWAFLNDCNMSMVQHGDSSFIIDDESNVIIDVDSLELERGFYRVGKSSQSEDNTDLMDNVLEILGAENIAEGGGVGEAPKRRKRR